MTQLAKVLRKFGGEREFAQKHPFLVVVHVGLFVGALAAMGASVSVLVLGRPSASGIVLLVAFIIGFIGGTVGAHRSIYKDRAEEGEEYAEGEI